MRARIGTAGEDGAATAHGCTTSVDIVKGYPVTVNDATFAEFAAGVAAQAFGNDAVVRMPWPVMGSEDFSYVLERVPGAMVFLGVCPPDRPDPFTAPACHSNMMMLHEDVMADGIALHAAVAMSFLTQR